MPTMISSKLLRPSALAGRQYFVTDAQKAFWNSYLATGRGSVSLFASIDKDGDGMLSPSDIRTFMHKVDQSGVLPKVMRQLDERAEEHPLTLQEFQSWLVVSVNDSRFLFCRCNLEESI
jgi:hypothetical protein